MQLIKLDTYNKEKDSDSVFAFKIMSPYEYYNYTKHGLMMLYLGKHHFWFKTYGWLAVKPKLKWVDTSKSNLKHGDGTPMLGYNDYIQRSYGISIDKTATHIHYGIQTGCWSKADPKNSDHSIVLFHPWTEHRLYRHTIYNPFNTKEVIAENIKNKINFFDWCEKAREIKKDHNIKFSFNDYDNEHIIATCSVEEREYRRGVKWCSWLQFFIKPIITRTLEIEFNKEIGPEKGSWKGGTMGHSIEMLPNETPFQAFTRYGNAKDHYKNHGEQNRRFTNIQHIV